MDEETRTRLVALLARPIVELTVAEAIWLALTLDDVDDTELQALLAE